MTIEVLSAELIERYLRTRGSRYFRGQHDGEYFYVANTRPRRLHVHLGISRWHRDEFTIQVTPGSFFPATAGAELAALAESWNAGHGDIVVTVRGSSDPRRVGVVARNCRKMCEPVDFDEFATFVDHTIAAAIEFFAEVPPGTDCPAIEAPLVLDAG